MSHLIGIDLGGTNIKALSLTPAGDVLSESSCATGDDSSGRFGERVRTLIDELTRRHGKPHRIGLAAPGLVARSGRSIAFMPNRLQGLERLDWTDYLKSDSPVAVLNDAHAALLGEFWKGAAAGTQNAFMLTLGTGVGGAILSEGRLLRGQIGRAGHLGHISLHADGNPDIVGIPGSLEDAIGECTLAQRTKGAFKSTRELVEAAQRGEANAREIWLRSVRELSCAIAGLINVLDPEVVIIGGGIARAGEALFAPLSELLAQYEWRPAGHRVRIVPAQLGEKAGAMGAAYNAMKVE
ncbi:MAG TPA: ROK family protein [Planctomycetota bacterium]|nr:ROK family protein [Planctomycetota bacterium]